MIDTGSLYGPGWTGYASVLTTNAGTVATPPPSMAAPGPSQPQDGAGKGCLMCSHPAMRQAIFIVGVGFLFLSWHTHLKSILE